jgi:hypothetical protein
VGTTVFDLLILYEDFLELGDYGLLYIYLMLINFLFSLI